jgi:hypothetical protein
MNFRLTQAQLAHLRTVGEALDKDVFPHVFQEGFVALAPLEDAPSKEQADGERQRARGPSTRSWTGTEAGSGRTSSQTASVRSGHQQPVRPPVLEELHIAYPTQFIEGDHGLWIVVTGYPLGTDGPQVTFVVAYPYADTVAPKAWGYSKLGDFPKFIGPRHTNFPDASICAFVPNEATWRRADGIVALIDLYSTWAFRHLYFEHFGRWPGQQHGPSALYRRTEFRSDEWCGCGSGLRYAACHEAADALLSEEEAREEHRRVMGADYSDRRPPRCVSKFVRSRFKKVPAFKHAYGGP